MIPQASIEHRARPWTYLTFGLFALYYGCQAVVRLALPGGLRIDEAQQVFLSQWLLAGYDAQPPLYNWAQQFAFALVGDYLVGLAALKSLVLFAVLVTYHQVARMLLKSECYAVIATIALFSIPQMFWQAQRDLTHTTAAMLLLNLLMLTAIVVLRSPTLLNYLLLGAAIGLGMLTKYNFALFLPALSIAVFLHPDGRTRITDWRILVTAATAATIVLPHALWFVENIGLASSVTVARMGEEANNGGRLGEIFTGIRNLLEITLIIATPAFATVCLPFGNAGLKLLGSSSAESRLIGDFLAATMTFLVLLIFIVTLTTFRDRWMLPLLQMLPLYLVLKLEARGLNPEAALKRLLPVAAGVLALLPIATFVAGSKSISHYQQPYSAFHDRFVAQEAHTPSLIVTPDWLSAGNIKKEWPEIAVITTQFPNLTLPYRWEHDRPVALMWRGEAQTAPKALQNWAKDNLGDAVVIPEAKRVTLPFEGNSGIAAPDFSYVLIYP